MNFLLGRAKWGIYRLLKQGERALALDIHRRLDTRLDDMQRMERKLGECDAFMRDNGLSLRS